LEDVKYQCPGDLQLRQISATFAGHDLGTELQETADALLPVQVTFSQGGASSVATPVFAGLAPGFIGVAQINVQIPADSPQGAVSLRLTSGPAVSSPVTISVQ
jgi:uncharacterized protein (TIGR03437 family)